MWRKTENDMEKRKGIRRSCFLALTIAFFVFVAGITYYSVKQYRGSLPAVSITEFAEVELNGQTYDTAVPREALYSDEGEMAYHLFSVGQREGPWGQEFYVVQNSVLCPDEWYGNEELEKVPVVCMDTVEGAVIVEHEGELCPGEEIRVAEAASGDFR